MSLLNIFSTLDAPFYDQEIYGTTVEQEYHAYPVYDPVRVACDAPTVIRQWLETHPVSVEALPTTSLESLGVSLHHTLVADLNGDGQDDWLIWPESLMPPFFFAAFGDQYTVSQPAIDPYRRSDGVAPRQLPENSGIGLVYLYSDIWMTTYKTPWECVYLRNCGVGGEYCYPELNIWQMQGTELKSIFQEHVCHSNLTSLFPGGEGTTWLDGGIEHYEEGSQKEYKYSWNSEQQTYIPDPPPTPTPNFTLTPEPPAEPYFSVWDAFGEKDYAYVVEHTTSIRSADLTAEWALATLGDYYYRALALEALNRPDEALAEYVAIAEAAPDSAWAKLAALHFEPTP
ncbi:MAG TPA: tetratricopeptide repeat protein [Phototrophicaceae bacterium]|nr:tetratricopeptide repeat protein [Phototrophicaceae bacterium]